MGKAKQFKKLRREAAGLPVMGGKRTVVEVQDGADLIKAGVLTDQRGDEIKPRQRYKGRGKIDVPVDHRKNMKAAYYRNGEMGVQAYIGAIKQVAESQGVAIKEVL